MKWLNLGLIRLFEFITLLLYSFFVLTYFGAFLLLPLDVLTLTNTGLEAIGLPTLVSFPIAGAATGYLGYLVYKMPGLYQTVVNGGIELTNAGHAQLRQLEAVAAAINGSSADDTSPSTT
ncbi:MAG TPA: hypothetical protein ENI90_03605 [Methylothermaceae bacterium]|nr:hypothetical protein [Methylothermaceae bacterium]